MDSLLALKSAIQTNTSLTLSSSNEGLLDNNAQLPDSSIGTAKYLFFPQSVPYFSSITLPESVSSSTSNGVFLELDTLTRYHTNNKTVPVSLRTVYNAWLTRDLKGPDYISQANEQNIQYLKIVERLDLLGWLKGDLDSENIKDIQANTSTSLNGAGKKSDSLATDTPLGENSLGPNKSALATDTPTNDRNVAEGLPKPEAASKNPLDIPTVVEETLPSKEPPYDPTVADIYKNEHVFLDHNSALHGSKLIDFSQVGKECRESIINVVKNAHRSSSGRNGHHQGQQNRHQQYPPNSANGRNGVSGRNPYDRNPNAPGLAPRPTSVSTGGLLPRAGSASSHGAALSRGSRPKDPIILLSPSTSALLNMGNVRAFLEQGEFIPKMSGLGAPDLIHINRYSTRLGHQNSSNAVPSSSGSSTNGNGNKTKIKFVVVDNVDKFTKPEYWDRVVAVFVTGQAWQFKSYRWPSPSDLFQHVAGFYLAYQGERVPPELGTWRNVMVTQIPKNERFRDREAAEMIWNQIEKWMLSKGWKF